MKKILLISTMLIATSPASAFIDLGFVDIPGQSVGYEARIRQFGDPAQSVDYWFATNVPVCCGAFPHDFGAPFGVEYLQLASQLGLALASPAQTGPVTPGVPEPSTWLMLILGFLGLAVWKGRGHFHDAHQPI